MAHRDAPPSYTRVEHIQTTSVSEDQHGASMVEYVFLAMLIGLVCVSAVAFLGKNLSSQYSSVASGVAGN